MTEFVARVYTTVPRDIIIALGADIGGTNSNFGFFQLGESKPVLLFSLHTRSKTIVDFTQVVVDALAYARSTYNLSVYLACFAAAGVASDDRMRCKPTNLPFTVDIEEILKATKLKCAFLANDFEVIGHGLEMIDQKNIVQVKEGNARKYANKAIIGAGTGLGKVIMNWDIDHYGRYMPVCSEGGHADFPVHSEKELQLIFFIQTMISSKNPVSWEDVLSGYGISRLYKFFQSINSLKKSSAQLTQLGLHPDEIFKSRHLDDHARNTFEWYSLFYGRCAKNFALESLALGGLYIAGGIAAKNVQLFQMHQFQQEFILNGKQQDLLTEIPIYVITDYNISLYGAIAYMLLEKYCAIE